MSHLIRLWSRTQGLSGLVGSGLGLVVAFCVALAVPASADSVADLNRPSSTIPGCVNTWNPLDPKYGGRTCEGQAVAQSWQERATAIITARNVTIDASRDPNRADKETVLGALSTLAAAADAINSSFPCSATRRMAGFRRSDGRSQRCVMMAFPAPAIAREMMISDHSG